MLFIGNVFIKILRKKNICEVLREITAPTARSEKYEITYRPLVKTYFTGLWA
jgi:hypothetical protein